MEICFNVIFYNRSKSFCFYLLNVSCIKKTYLKLTNVSFGILFFIRYIVLFERFTITEKSIFIEYPIIGKKLEYKNDDLIKWYEHINYGRFGEYKSFHFKTSDNKIFMFVDYQFSNYKDLIISISGKVKFDYINKMHNLKFLFIHWIISVLIVSLVILIVLKLII